MAQPARERIPYSLAARQLLRDTLLDAACDELQERRWADITMADIARAAGVSRQTLYKEFGSRDEFSQALVLREAERFLLAVRGAVHANLDNPARAMSAIVMSAQRRSPSSSQAASSSVSRSSWRAASEYGMRSRAG